MLFRIKLQPEPAGSQETFSAFGRAVLEDNSTADFTIRCATKNFRVHKTFLCVRLDDGRVGLFN